MIFIWCLAQDFNLAFRAIVTDEQNCLGVKNTVKITESYSHTLLVRYWGISVDFYRSITSHLENHMQSTQLGASSLGTLTCLNDKVGQFVMDRLCVTELHQLAF